VESLASGYLKRDLVIVAGWLGVNVMPDSSFSGGSSPSLNCTAGSLSQTPTRNYPVVLPRS
jgi:hypothetical protein